MGRDRWGLGISTDSGTTFINRTTADGLGLPIIYGVYESGVTVCGSTRNAMPESSPTLSRTAGPSMAVIVPTPGPAEQCRASDAEPPPHCRSPLHRDSAMGQPE